MHMKLKKILSLVQLAINNVKKTKRGVTKQVEAMHIKKIAAEIQKFDELVEIKINLQNQMPTKELLVENLISKKSLVQHDFKELKIQESFYEENREVIENLENILRQKGDKQKLLIEKNSQLEFCENTLLDLYRSHGYFEQQVESYEEKERNLINYRDDYEAHDLYMKCMHPNGIAYDIIKKSLPTINSEISKILANIVDFQVCFETEDNRLDIYIQQPDRDASPLEMASGAEKTVAAMAIRLAFTNISSLPKSQIFVLDEPGTSLDEERMEGFVRILDVTSSIFKTVILISHLDSLKDAADSIINIEKKDGYANVVA